jgi:holin-like protein
MLARVSRDSRLNGSAIVSLACKAAFLWLLNALGNLLVQAVGMPVPGSLVGMLLLLALLSLGVVTPHDLEDLTTPLLRHMPLLFVPLVVGAVAWSDLLSAHLVVLSASLLGGVVLGMLVSGASAQWAGRLKLTRRPRGA